MNLIGGANKQSQLVLQNKGSIKV